MVTKKHPAAEASNASSGNKHPNSNDGVLKTDKKMGTA
jgi:hypothetical protein